MFTHMRQVFALGEMFLLSRQRGEDLPSSLVRRCITGMRRGCLVQRGVALPAATMIAANNEDEE